MTMLKIEDLYCRFQLPWGGRVEAVAGIDLEIESGETLGLVGESGCGKSTLARALLQLPPPTSGRILLDGEDWCQLRGRSLRQRRWKMQMVFQDPVASLNPRRTIGEAVSMPLVGNGQSRSARRKAALEMLESVGLDAAALIDRRPGELSGGQCQRVSIARALIARPRVLICDEPVSSLDVSVQAQVLNLLGDARQQYGLSMLFIAHDLAVVRGISHRIAVMYLGRLCEVGPAESLTASPLHPYSRSLLEAMPDPERPGRRREPTSVAKGEMPSPLAPPAGCRFHTRCPMATEICRQQVPPLRTVAPGRKVACHHVEAD